MKDNLGIYYYPYPQNKRIKTYVRRNHSEIEFRLRNDDDPKMWKKHGWISWEAIQQAKQLYNRKNLNSFDPNQVYNKHLAETLITTSNN